MRRKNQRSHWFVLTVMLTLSVSLLLLSWPRLVASLRFLPVDRAIEQYYLEQQVPTDRLAVLIDYAQEAIDHHDHYRYRNGLSFLHYLRGFDIYTPALERREAYRLSESEAVASLSRAPAQPAVWLRLASIRWILHDEPEKIIEPWKMSVFTGRTHSGLYELRVELGIAQAGVLDSEGLRMLRDQLLLSWRVRPGSLTQVLARRDPQLEVTRKLLAETSPATLEEMEVWLEKVR